MIKFKKEFKEFINYDPNQLSLITYDLVGLFTIYFQKFFEIDDNIFKKKIDLKVYLGYFQIKNKKINHELKFL